MDHGLTFNPETHEYRIKGKVVPHVTGVLRPLTKLWGSRESLETARQEGTAIHKMVELECKGELDEESLPGWMVPYLTAWRKFVADTGFEVEGTEFQGYSEAYGYAGTCDLSGVLTKLKGKPLVVIDIKRTLGGKTTGLQLAGYGHLLWPNPTRYFRRFGLQLDPLRFVEYDGPNDWTVFLAALMIHQWRVRNHV